MNQRGGCRVWPSGGRGGSHCHRSRRVNWMGSGGRMNCSRGNRVGDVGGAGHCRNRIRVAGGKERSMASGAGRARWNHGLVDPPLENGNSNKDAAHNHSHRQKRPPAWRRGLRRLFNDWARTGLCHNEGMLPLFCTRRTAARPAHKANEGKINANILPCFDAGSSLC